jgi:hypothetical protein
VTGGDLVAWSIPYSNMTMVFGGPRSRTSEAGPLGPSRLVPLSPKLPKCWRPTRATAQEFLWALSGLSLALNQSPFLNVLSDDRVVKPRELSLMVGCSKKLIAGRPLKVSFRERKVSLCHVPEANGSGTK